MSVKCVRVTPRRFKYSRGIMNDVERLVEIASKSTIPVILFGESGTGKEVMARRLHELSPRANEAFVAVNCGAISPGLVESLFEGSCRGAYTGAVANQIGFVRAADRGTLFLDEIGELPLESQTRLLRILQEKSVMPVGAQRSIPVDFRLVCATHRNLESAVRSGRFREDLFFRLNVFPIRLRPLRERLDEFRAIAEELWSGLSPRSLSAQELRSLKAFPWPGNVRQLKNVLERFHLLQDLGRTIDEVLAEEPRSLHALQESCNKTIRRIAPSWENIQETLLECAGNKSRAAQTLGISRGSLCYQLKKNADRPKLS